MFDIGECTPTRLLASLARSFAAGRQWPRAGRATLVLVASSFIDPINDFYVARNDIMSNDQVEYLTTARWLAALNAALSGVMSVERALIASGLRLPVGGSLLFVARTR